MFTTDTQSQTQGQSVGNDTPIKLNKQNGCDSQIKALKYKNAGMCWNANSKKTETDMNNLENLLESERIENDNGTWSKLNKTIKIKKILVYASKYKESNNLSSEEYENLIGFLKDCLDKKKLQRVKDVEYNRETGEILSIPALFYNKNNSHFTLKNLAKKVTTLKSFPSKKTTHQNTVSCISGNVETKSSHDEIDDIPDLDHV